MNIGKQFQGASTSIDEAYKPRFISKTKKLLNRKVNETHTFLDASLIFKKGRMVWRQDLPIIDLTKPKSSTNPLMNPKINVTSVDEAYKLFKEYYVTSWFSKKAAYVKGMDDLEKYCNE